MSFMIFIASVRDILDRHSYSEIYVFQDHRINTCFSSGCLSQILHTCVIGEGTGVKLVMG
jgi:hypothetical protein